MNRIIEQGDYEKLLLHVERLELALKESEEKYQSLYNNSHLMMLIIEPSTGKIIDANPVSCQYYGYSQKEMRTKTIFDINTLSKEETLAEMALAVQEKRKHFNFTHRLANNEIRHVEVYSGPICIQGRKLLYSIIHDITDKVMIAKSLQESENHYRSLMELAPCGVVVFCNKKIVFANPAAAILLGAKEPKDLEGVNFINLIDEEYREIARKRIKRILINKNTNTIINYSFTDLKGKKIQVEAASAFFDYKGKPAVQTVFWDVTERKKELDRAARIQKKRLTTQFPIKEKGKLEVLYKPASFISGDLFHFYRLNEHTVIGLLADVMGKGVTAALSNSAVKVLFYEIAARVKDPLKIIEALNKETPEFLEDEYIAACCFAFDFLENTCQVVCAGISSFSVKLNGRYYLEETLPGSFLGMFKDSVFESKIYKFKTGDVFYFYTDGLEELLDKSWVKNKFTSFTNINKQKKFLESVTFDNEDVKDDLTWLAIEIL